MSSKAMQADIFLLLFSLLPRIIKKQIKGGPVLTSSFSFFVFEYKISFLGFTSICWQMQKKCILSLFLHPSPLPPIIGEFNIWITERYDAELGARGHLNWQVQFPFL